LSIPTKYDWDPSTLRRDDTEHPWFTSELNLNFKCIKEARVCWTHQACVLLKEGSNPQSLTADHLGHMVQKVTSSK